VRSTRDRLVEREAALLHQHQGGDRRDRLAHRCNAKQGIALHRRAGFGVAVTLRIGIGQFTVPVEQCHDTGDTVAAFGDIDVAFHRLTDPRETRGRKSSCRHNLFSFVSCSCPPSLPVVPAQHDPAVLTCRSHPPSSSAFQAPFRPACSACARLLRTDAASITTFAIVPVAHTDCVPDRSRRGIGKRRADAATRLGRKEHGFAPEPAAQRGIDRVAAERVAQGIDKPRDLRHFLTKWFGTHRFTRCRSG
jgi:hypothetical protein